MSQISFTSTYRIPLIERKVSVAKRQALKDLASQYENHVYPNGNKGCVRVSIPEEQDGKFEQNLRQKGFKVYQKFEEHNLPEEKIDAYIKQALKFNEYKQYGKQK